MRQCAHGTNPGTPRASAARSPRVTSAHNLYASRRTMPPCTSWTWPLARGNATGDDCVDDRPPRPASSRRPHRLPPEATNRKITAAHRRQQSPEKEAAPDDATSTRRILINDNVPVHTSDDRRSSNELANPLPPPCQRSPLVDNDDDARPSDPRLIQRPANNMEPTNTKFYQLGNDGDLIFEKDLNALSDFLGRPHPEFHGVEVNDQPGGELQWVITADLRGKMESPTSERILFTFRESNWLDGLARALQEALARLCGQNDQQRRAYANQTHLALANHADAIKMLAKDRKTLRLQRAKKNATITRLRARIASLEATVKAQEDQLNEMEEDGEDLQGGEAFLSDDDDFEEDENTEEEDYEFLEAGEDDFIPIDVDDE
ncbi:hypothetical protein QYE76_019321 [Lolium multiflorum]|uniref:Uncharacterized protein n=1 Tax=Lolium multiflorum TaxID=4521 RepID=A0AAD8VP01_LOLMU|nr:hypothetical protein QYE76_019321 [Lolium multiflorum]